MTRSQGDEPIALAVEEWIATDEDPRRPLLDEGRKRRVDVAFGAGVKDPDFPSERARGVLHVFRFRPQIRARRIYEHRDRA